MLSKVNASFRDPSGYVYCDENKVFRTINHSYQKDWECAVSSNLLEKLKAKKQIISFKYADTIFDKPDFDNVMKVLEVEKIPFITYPYEWSFPQLKEAALLTLEIQKEALMHGMTLKDASAYNVQFLHGKAIFIDLLSFEIYKENSPWQAYRQFCMHFLAPLALQSYDYRLTRLSSLWIDGIPLDIAWKMLPSKAAFSGGLQLHLHLHARAEKKYEDGNIAAKNTHKNSLSKKNLFELIDSLIRTIKALPMPKEIGEWAEYYDNTNYSSISQKQKEALVIKNAQKFSGTLAFDLGANTGKYSTIISDYFDDVVAADIDSTAVARYYNNLPKKNILPIVLDLANPSPAIGWACDERMAITQRQKASFITALALTHHLFFTAGIPWNEQAKFFSTLLKEQGALLVEFVGKQDSQVQHMLSTRDDIFTEYHLEAFRESFAHYFFEEEVQDIEGSHRKLFTFIKK